MQRTAVVERVKSGTRRNPFTDGLDERLQVLERGIGKHAVTQVEHMTRAAACAPEDVARSFDHQLTSSAMRQSSETTSGPAEAISRSRPAVFVPKWILGTSSTARASKMRRVWGRTRCS